MNGARALRCAGAITVVLSVLVAFHGPASTVLSLFVGATVAHGLVLSTGGAFVLRKIAATIYVTLGMDSTSTVNPPSWLGIRHNRLRAAMEERS